MNSESNAAMSGVRTEVLCLKDVVEYRNLAGEKAGLRFLIPSYQRPYVWSDDDVLKLFEDISNACLRGDPNYFIGTTLSSRRDLQGDEMAVLELVDGQQRTTTLMLICIAFSQADEASNLSKLAVYKGKNKKLSPRLQFDIRESVQQLLGAKAGLSNDYQEPSTEEIKSNPYLKRISEALRVLGDKINPSVPADETACEQVSRKALGKYIYEHVQWVNNVLPEGTDLNRLFTTMNTAGVQLEQSDILKAKLLKNVNTDKPVYEAIWSACEQMESYFERNVRQLFSATRWGAVQPEGLARFSEHFKLEKSEAQSVDVHVGEAAGKKIEDLFKELSDSGASVDRDSDIGSGKETSDTGIGEQENNRIVYCRSIIGFPLLLVHAYRIFRLEEGSSLGDIHKPVHSKYLLEIFKPLLGESVLSADKEALPTANPDEACIKRFFETLWRVRYALDRWVVKWVEDEGDSEPRLGLTNQSVSNSEGKRYISRSERAADAMLMLQSVRYFTGDRNAQYWLTPFLAMVLGVCESSEQKVDVPRGHGSSRAERAVELKMLEDVDDQMSLSSGTRQEASFALAKGETLNLTSYFRMKRYFVSNKGTGYQHYWFQKLEYLLWKKLELVEGKSAESGFKSEASLRKDYRIRSRNSVEHVYPQLPEKDGVALAAKALHSFGNLALLSPGENSSYSNQTVRKKQADFVEFGQLSSLKLREIFKAAGPNGEWTGEKIKKHRKDMLVFLSEHYEGLGCARQKLKDEVGKPAS